MDKNYESMLKISLIFCHCEMQPYWTSSYLVGCKDLSHESRSTWLDVVSDNGHMIITVRSSVLVPKANYVPKFVNDDAKLVAVLPNGYCLGSIATTTDVRATPWKQKHKKLNVWRSQLNVSILLAHPTFEQLWFCLCHKSVIKCYNECNEGVMGGELG